MAIYHMSAQIIGRSAGRSSIAAAAYRAGEKLKDEEQGKSYDYTDKSGVEHSEIMAPKNAPEWVADRQRLWQEVEAAEKRKDSTLAREVQVALPRELSKEGQIEAIRRFAQDNFVNRGMVADLTIHRDNPENPHAHILLTTREIGPEGFGKKNREWNDKNYLKGWREDWERCANSQLMKEGIDARIDHRSYKEQGIDLIPQSHIGTTPEKMSKEHRVVVFARMIEQQEIAKKNGEKIIEKPEIAIDALTRQQSTFTQRDVGRYLHSRTDDAEQFKLALTRVMASEKLVGLGKDSEGRERFSTQEIIEREKRMMGSAREMDGRANHQISDRKISQAEASKSMSEDQKAAYRHLVERTGDLSVVEGYAGTGKSYLLGAAREAWESEGYRVLGATLSGKAAEGLEQSSGIKSRSIASLEWAWDQGRDNLGKKDVLVIDEAGMVGSRQMDRILEHAKSSGAKVVLVGDTQQLQAIESGAPMRKIGEEIGSQTLGEIRRQKEEWQREASEKMATGRTLEALESYQKHGKIHEHQTQKDAMGQMVSAWAEHRQSHPESTQIMLAYRRDEVRELNEQARGIRRSSGELGRDVSVETERGKRDFAEQDRVYFLKNDRQMGVKNGTLGTVEAVDSKSMTVLLDDTNRKVKVDLGQYNQLDHGYAATVHKSQGVTVDRAHVLASDLYDRHSAYVGMTRHREGVDLHYSREAFESREKLNATLTRARPKDMALDYEPPKVSGEKAPAPEQAQPKSWKEQVASRMAAKSSEQEPQSKEAVPKKGWREQVAEAQAKGADDRQAIIAKLRGPAKNPEEVSQERAAVIAKLTGKPAQQTIEAEPKKSWKEHLAETRAKETEKGTGHERDGKSDQRHSGLYERHPGGAAKDRGDPGSPGEGHQPASRGHEVGNRGLGASQAGDRSGDGAHAQDRAGVESQRGSLEVGSGGLGGGSTLGGGLRGKRGEEDRTPGVPVPEKPGYMSGRVQGASEYLPGSVQEAPKQRQAPAADPPVRKSLQERAEEIRQERLESARATAEEIKKTAAPRKSLSEMVAEIKAQQRAKEESKKMEEENKREKDRKKGFGMGR